MPVVLTYVLQGLYHPVRRGVGRGFEPARPTPRPRARALTRDPQARRVREVYWKIYNTLYIYGADALTMAYPTLDSDGVNSYRRTQLEVFI